MCFSDVCLQPGTIGGFEADSSAISCPSPDPSNDIVDGKFNGEHHPEKVPLRAQQNGLCPFNVVKMSLSFFCFYEEVK